MVSFRRKAERPDQQHASVDPAQDQAATDEEDEANPVARVSRYGLIKNADEHDDSGDEWVGHVAAEDVQAADAEGAAALAAVATEVQTVLVSAQDAAAKIRRRAEEEAEEILNEARAAAEAEAADANRSAEVARTEADRIRAEAEAYATDARSAADVAAEERVSEADRQAEQILEEVQRRRDALEAEFAQKVEQTDAEASQRVETLGAEIERQEERLNNILVVLQGMSSQLAAVLHRQETSDDLAHTLANLTVKR
jgi:hypothetical protein